MSTLIHTQGIILKTQKYGETSMISQVMTREHGMLSLIMGSVTSSVARKALFQIMNQVEFTIYYHEYKTLHRVKEAKYLTIYQSLPFEINRSAVGIFILELLRKSLKQHDKDEEMYDWIKYCLNICDDPNARIGPMPLYFCLGLTRYLGFCPLVEDDKPTSYFDLREGCFQAFAPMHKDYLSDNNAALLKLLVKKSEYSEWPYIQFLPNQKKEILYALLDYYRIHVDQFQGLESLEILEGLINA